MNNNCITVGIPFYKGSNMKHLEEAIESILNQTLFPDEIHLIQDGPISLEKTKFIKNYEKKYDNIKHLIIKKNSGLSVAINFSILESNSEFYARMDDDDIAKDDRLEKQVSFLNENKNIDVVGSWAEEFKKNINEKNIFLKKLPQKNNEIKKFFHYRTPFVHPTVVFRRTVFSKIGLYNPKKISEDLDLWARLLNNDIKCENLNESLLYFRVDNEMIKKRSQPKRVLSHLISRFKYNTLSPKLNFLKISSIIFRFFPYKVQEWLYNNFRKL